MENKKKMFTGFTKVFDFTAKQTMKGKGFKSSSIVIGIIIAIIAAAISIIMAAVQLGNDEDDSFIDIDPDKKVEGDFYYVNDSTLEDKYIEELAFVPGLENIKFIKTDIDEAKDEKKFLESHKDAVLMVFSESNEDLKLNMYLDEGVDSYLADTIGDAFYQYMKMSIMGDSEKVDEKTFSVFIAGSYYETMALDKSDDNVPLTLAKVFIPMIFSLALYMMILLYGQNITKIIVAEKSSKLMETLLTSVKPYAIVSGKIVAVAGLAIMQMIIWILFGVVGYNAGTLIAESINPDYVNYASVMVDLIVEGGAELNAVSVIIALLITFVGFFMYSVFAGMVGAMVDKVEDLSNVMAIFQLPVIFGFMAAYFVNMMENDVLRQIVTYLPITSPFALPADLLVGNVTMLEASTSLLIILATTFGLIVLTGKIYKGKLFNRH